MSCTSIEYANATLVTTGMQLRFNPLPFGVRIPTKYTITTTAAAIVGAETLAVTALPAKLWCGDVLVFNSGGTATVARDTAIAGTSLKVVPLTTPIATGATAQTTASVYAAVTEASPNASPKIEDVTNSLSGTGYEGATVASNQQLSLTMDRVSGSPGNKLLLDILYKPEHLKREIYAGLVFPNGEKYQGACIPTTGSQSGAVQAKRTMQVNLQFQGCSFEFVQGTDAAVVDWPTI